MADWLTDVNVNMRTQLHETKPPMHECFVSNPAWPIDISHAIYSGQQSGLTMLWLCFVFIFCRPPCTHDIILPMFFGKPLKNRVAWSILFSRQQSIFNPTNNCCGKNVSIKSSFNSTYIFRYIFSCAMVVQLHLPASLSPVSLQRVLHFQCRQSWAFSTSLFCCRVELGWELLVYAVHGARIR